MTDPRFIARPSDLADGPIVCDGGWKLKFTLPRRIGFDFHWLREAARGVLEGDLGLRVDADAGVMADVSIDGRFRQVVSLDEKQWLRLQVIKHSTNGDAAAGRRR